MHSVKRFAFLAAVAAFTLLGPFFFGYHFSAIRDNSLEYLNAASRSRLSNAPEADDHKTKGFHLILPATAPNSELCKLLMSAGITDYPEPIFVGWAGRGIYNGTQTHLFKITEILSYLRGLPASADDDLTLILDAYDVWMQLRPDVLIRRYYEVLRKNDERIKAEGIYGKHHGGAVIKHTIVQGPDKLAWPQDDVTDPATWAVPESPLPPTAFGPLTDTDMFNTRPRWLNSGTIMGPVKDMRDMFAATVDMLSRRFDSAWEHSDSDQYYFAEVWAEQEVQRMQLRDGKDWELPILSDGETPKMPYIYEGKRTEYGICLDYETEMFQPASAFDRHLTWMRFNGSTTAVSAYPGDAKEIATTLQESTALKRIDQWTLQQDTIESEGPWAAAPTGLIDLQQRNSWEDVMLGVNVVTQIAFAIFHCTGDKTLRERWWPRMWFHPWGEQLLKAAKRRRANSEDPNVFLVHNGVTYKQARPDGQYSYRGPGADEKGGAWKADGDYIPWRDMCAQHEDKVFLRQHHVNEQHEK